MKKLFLICFTAIVAVAITTSGSATKQSFSSPILKTTLDTVPRGNRMDSSNRWKNNSDNRSKGKMHHRSDSSMNNTDNGAINSNSNNGNNSGSGDSSSNRPPR